MVKNKEITELEIYRDALSFSNMIWNICSKWDIFERKTIGTQLVRCNSLCQRHPLGIGLSVY